MDCPEIGRNFNADAAASGAMAAENGANARSDRCIATHWPEKDTSAASIARCVGANAASLRPNAASKGLEAASFRPNHRYHRKFTAVKTPRTAAPRSANASLGRKRGAMRLPKRSPSPRPLSHNSRIGSTECQQYSFLVEHSCSTPICNRLFRIDCFVVPVSYKKRWVRRAKSLRARVERPTQDAASERAGDINPAVILCIGSIPHMQHCLLRGTKTLTRRSRLLSWREGRSRAGV